MFLPCSLLLAANAAGAISLSIVNVGDAGNPNDQDYGIGALGGVSYTFAISTYEVTLAQYTAFLNAVAATDTFNLYNPSMATDLNISGIMRNGTSGSYTYSVIGDGSRPVTYVSWFDAARFSNWLQNGQPSGFQVVGTTESGAYTLNGATSGVGFARGGSALYWIPSESEWYKAAYYQPAAAGGDSDGYRLYPTANNATPNSRNGSTSDENSANFFRSVAPTNDGVNDGFAVSGSTTQSSTQNYLTPAGAFILADSYYGTFDQAGNVYEWTDGVSGSSRSLRGGSWFSNSTGPAASNQFLTSPASEFDTVGFRIAVIPEPSGALLLLTGAAVLGISRRKHVVP